LLNAKIELVCGCFNRIEHQCDIMGKEKKRAEWLKDANCRSLRHLESVMVSIRTNSHPLQANGQGLGQTSVAAESLRFDFLVERVRNAPTQAEGRIRRMILALQISGGLVVLYSPMTGSTVVRHLVGDCGTLEGASPDMVSPDMEAALAASRATHQAETQSQQSQSPSQSSPPAVPVLTVPVPPMAQAGPVVTGGGSVAGGVVGGVGEGGEKKETGGGGGGGGFKSNVLYSGEGQQGEQGGQQGGQHDTVSPGDVDIALGFDEDLREERSSLDDPPPQATMSRHLSIGALPGAFSIFLPLFRSSFSPLSFLFLLSPSSFIILLKHAMYIQ
jgi:hypothetical protein